MEDKNTKLEWIPLACQLPEVGKPVLGFSSATKEINVVYMTSLRRLDASCRRRHYIVEALRYFVKTIYQTGWGSWADQYIPIESEITHWMPIPELPNNK